ncbi:MAG: Do family serine endopeptidase [Rhodospirillales bacterium]
MRFFKIAAVLTAVAPAVLGISAGLMPAWAETPTALNPSALNNVAPLPSLAPLVRQVTPAVVNVAVEGREAVESSPLFRDPQFRKFFNMPDQPKERKVMAAGSGVIIDAKNGYVMTNNHVVDKADKIVITLKDGRSFTGKLVGTDPGTDIAVVKIPAENLTALPLGDSNKLEVGDYVVAVGNPFGLGQTVTSGIVSATGRSGLKIEGYEDFIQTDASINPGNSGGALVNLRGELIGINTAILAPSGGNVGIGFAVPIRMAHIVADQLVAYGKVQRGRVGVQIQDVTPDIAGAMGLDKVGGALIARVEPGSPADKAGLKQGDVVTAVDGQAVRNSSDLRNHVGLVRVGEKVEIAYRRGKSEDKVTVQVADLPNAQVQR